MSDVTPEVVATEATPAEEVAKQDLPVNQEKKLTGRAALRAKLTAKSDEVFNKIQADRAPKAVAPAETPTSEAPTEAAPAVAALEEAGVEVPEQKKTESDSQYATKVAKLLLQVQRAEANGLKYKSDFEKVSARNAELEAKFAEVSADPVKALKLANMSPDEMAQAMIDGKLSKSEEKVVKQELPPEVLELIEEGKRLKAEKLEREEKTKADEQRTKNVKIVDDAKQAIIDKFPTLDLIPSDRLFDAYSQVTAAQGEEPPFEDFAEMMQKNVLAELVAGVGHKGTLKAIIAAKPELREFLIAELGLKAAAPVAAPVVTTPAVQKTLGKVVPETPTRTETMSVKERNARMNSAAGKVFT